MTLSSTRPVLVLLALGLFAIGTDGYVITSLLPDVGHALGVSDSAAGQLITVFALAYAVGAPVLGVLTGGLPRRPLLIGSLAVFALTNAGVAIAGSYPVMMVVRVLAALAAAVFTPACSATAAVLADDGRRGRALATVAAGVSLSTALGVPLGALVGAAFGWRVTFLAIAVLAALATAGLALLLPSVQTPPATGLRARIAVARTRGVPTALGLTVLWIAGAFTVLTYINPVLGDLAGVRGSGLAVWLLVFGVAAVAGNAVGGRAADGYPATSLAVVTTAGLALALTTFGVLASLGVHGRTGMVAAAVVLAVWGVFGWAFMPVQQHRLVELAAGDAGVVLSLSASATYIGISLGGFAGSLALTSGGVAAVGWTAGAIESCAVLAAVAIAVAHRRVRGVRAAASGMDTATSPTR
ncbi:MFS transporter [Amycolatopsis viridis]|uniref:MFS family arabinose efflux permease n=1 Tax=Amycolatopsis viridis TaxID=185678 RepID=A0ABX0SMY0_9PSEU|nr:MFS transporter [Amycolatopsis viridis]NIH77893.1 putative MFS family arabinose efflux permease [Amycolatopsis viridis]